MQILAETLTPPAAYKLLTGIVVPRPIAWITTRSEANIINLAPFSAFLIVSTNPPMVGFNAGKLQEEVDQPGDEQKDTMFNIHRSGQFVVNTVDEALLEPMHRSADYYPRGVSEVEALGLETVPSDVVDVPRLKAAPISMECVFSESVTFGRSGSEFIAGEVKVLHIRDDLCVNGKIDSAALRPLARIAGPAYAQLGKIIQCSPNKVRKG